MDWEWELLGELAYSLGMGFLGWEFFICVFGFEKSFDWIS